MSSRPAAAPQGSLAPCRSPAGRETRGCAAQTTRPDFPGSRPAAAAPPKSAGPRPRQPRAGYCGVSLRRVRQPRAAALARTQQKSSNQNKYSKGSIVAEYDIDFAARLARIASELEEQAPLANDARRSVVYLGRLSAEIAMKALLEKAGFPVERIRSRNHDLRGLLIDLGNCEVEVEGSFGVREFQSASCVRDARIDLGVGLVPIGDIICAEDIGTSKYPNQIRYGQTVIDIHPSLVAAMAEVLAGWARSNWDSIKVAANKGG